VIKAEGDLVKWGYVLYGDRASRKPDHLLSIVHAFMNQHEHSYIHIQRFKIQHGQSVLQASASASVLSITRYFPVAGDSPYHTMYIMINVVFYLQIELCRHISGSNKPRGHSLPLLENLQAALWWRLSQVLQCNTVGSSHLGG
jgi:hypothetical protein